MSSEPSGWVIPREHVIKVFSDIIKALDMLVVVETRHKEVAKVLMKQAQEDMLREAKFIGG